MIAQLGDFLRAERAANRPFLPNATRILAALQQPLDDVRVLIVGQDPYPTPGHPVGLSFSVAPDVRPLPGSLRNILQEYREDLGLPQPANGDLTPWTQQGVLLLNRVLTVAPGNPGSHRGKGWEAVTEQAIRALALRDQPLVAILWGRDARTLKPLLTPHPCIESAHPSPLSAHNGFFGSRPFSRANAHARRAGRRADRLAPALTQAEVGEEEQRGRPRRLTVLVGALVFFDLVLWFAVAPLLPGWEESLHLSKAQSGIVVGAYSAAVLLASVPAGNLADQFGPRRVTIAATLLFGVAAPLHAFVGSFAELVGLRFAAGVFSAVSWSAALAWAIGSVPPAAARAHRGAHQHGPAHRRDRGPALRRAGRAARRPEGRDGRRSASSCWCSGRVASLRARGRARPSTSTSRCARASASSRATPGCSAPTSR